MNTEKLGSVVVSVIVSIAFGVACWLVLTRVGIPDNALTQMMCGYLAAKFGTVVDYWMGSSAGSKAKDQVIAAQAPAVKEPNP